MSGQVEQRKLHAIIKAAAARIPANTDLARMFRNAGPRSIVIACITAVLAWAPIERLAAAEAPPAAIAPRHMTPAQWREDLHVLVAQIEKIHPHPFHHISQSAFEAAVSRLDGDIPDLTDHQVEIRLAELVAMLGEGHSRLNLPGLSDPMSDVAEIASAKDPALAFRRLPVQLRLFSDGLFVVDAAPEFRSLIGREVVKVGDRSASVAIEAVGPLVNNDNEMGARLVRPNLIVVPEVLRALNLITDDVQIPLTLRAHDGTQSVVSLPPVRLGRIEPWILDKDVASQLAATHSADKLWAAYDAGSETLIAKINVIQDAPGLSVAQFARQLETLAAAHPSARFVIDLRDCHGGDNSKFRGLLLAIIRTPGINRLGKSFVLINRATFSAAVNSASDLERLSNAIFVGEPTGGAPSSWGDPRKATLPNSGLVARISSVYWRDWTSDEARPWIAPDIAVADRSSDYFSGKDAVMATVSAFPPQTAFADVLANLAHAGAGGRTLLRLYYQHKTDPQWAQDNTRQALQGAGAAFVARKSYDDAFLMFAVNARDYPASVSSASAVVDKALRVEPDNADLRRLAKRLETLAPRD